MTREHDAQREGSGSNRRRPRRIASRVVAAVFLLASAGAAACNKPVTAASPDAGLEQRLQSRIARQPGALVEVAYIDLAGGETLFIDADSVMHAASTMKVPVMLRLYREADQHALSLARKVLLVNQFSSIVDGSSYTLDSTVDGDTAMYHYVGDSVTVRELVRHMITRSSNLATNTLIALANADSVNAMMRSLGASRMHVLRGVEDQKAFDAHLNNTATARDLSTLLRALQAGRAASPSATNEMRDILMAQEFNEKIPAGLPAGVRVAHKTGDITGIAHDAAIVYPAGRPPYILVVLTRGIPLQPTADSLIADISRDVYTHATGH
ncbi:MAG: class A beta-lactamase-related serine hydrolase [Gemmatimonadota bacterium]|nr:class A beta-lactamase-related serine hydrolase [Gemmatimonadota bacterium]